tara:strand:+ start:11944 stop:13080 length:1137 start_codon:yes stop_codon:yes gene_type:complete
MFSLLVLIAFSATPNEENIAKKIKVEKQSFIKKDKQVRYQLAELYKIQKQVKHLDEKIQKLEERKDNLTRKIRKLNQNIENVEEEIRQNNKILQARIRIAAQILDSSLQEIIVHSKSPNEIERVLKGLEALMENDIYMIQDVANKKKDYNEKKSDLKTKITAYAINKKEIKKSIKELMSLQKSKESVVSKLKSDKNKHMYALKILREQGEDMALLSETLTKSLAREILVKSFFEYKGQLVPPIEGRIVRTFGEKKDGLLRFLSKGIWIDGNFGQEVKSIADGKLVYYGKIDQVTTAMVIQHDDNYFSIYAPLRAGKYKVGDTIKAQEVIATLDRTLLIPGNALYFEIRHFSEPLNPQKWLQMPSRALTMSEGEKNEVH